MTSWMPRLWSKPGVGLAANSLRDKLEQTIDEVARGVEPSFRESPIDTKNAIANATKSRIGP